jgi:hypothetical protein|tara:strand:- start:1298 stop:2002 length:705 start_codon:yes stop_codon:yes gene_type:complete
MKTRSISVISLMMLSMAIAPLVAKAGTVDTSGVTTFSAGSAAKASEVNGNFSTVITAVNDNASSLAALQSSIEALQTQLESMPTKVTDVSDLVGRTYCMIQDHSAGRYDGNNFASVNFASETSTVTVTSETQLSITGVSSDEAELGLQLSQYSYNGSDVDGLQGTLEAYQEPESYNGTINSLSNGELSVTVGSDTIQFYVSKYGDVMIGRSFTDDSSAAPAEMWNTTAVLVECQ